jgi:O-antigen/teichoic acid export membrane protein
MESSSSSAGAPGPIQPLEYETADPDAPLGTDRLLADLGGHSARGGALMIVSEGAQLVLGFVSTLVLARILVPSDFGLVAIVVSITAFVSTIRDFGLPEATVQRQSITHAELSALFWLSLKLAALVALVLAALAPAIAWFYGEPQLTLITLVTTVGILVVGLSTVHMGLLRRQMRFSTITGIKTGSVAVGVATGIAAALLGAGLWALVLQQLTTNVTIGAALWLISRWRPAPPQRASGVGETDNEGMRSMVSYGKYLTCARMVNSLGMNLDVVLVGKFVGAISAGLYQKAQQWAGLTFWQLYSPLTDVLFASFSRLQPDRSRYRAYFRKTVMGLYFVTAPSMTFAVVEAQEIILLLLGPKWSAAVPIFRVMAVAAFAESVTHVGKWAYLAEGSTKRQLTWSMISTPLLVACVTAGLWWGALGVAWGYTAAKCLLAFPSLRFALNGSSLRISDFACAVWRPVLAAILAATALFGMRRVAPEMQYMILWFLRDVCFISVCYLGFWLATGRGRRELREMLSVLRHLRS